MDNNLEEGIYTALLTADDGTHISTSTATITVHPPGTFSHPFVRPSVCLHDNFRTIFLKSRTSTFNFKIFQARRNLSPVNLQPPSNQKRIPQPLQNLNQLPPSQNQLLKSQLRRNQLQRNQLPRSQLLKNQLLRPNPNQRQLLKRYRKLSQPTIQLLRQKNQNQLRKNQLPRSQLPKNQLLKYQQRLVLLVSYKPC